VIVADYIFLGWQRRDAVFPDGFDGIILLVVYVIFMENVVFVFA
jgi:hypothetical protein